MLRSKVNIFGCSEPKHLLIAAKLAGELMLQTSGGYRIFWESKLYEKQISIVGSQRKKDLYWAYYHKKNKSEISVRRKERFIDSQELMVGSEFEKDTHPKLGRKVTLSFD